MKRLYVVKLKVDYEGDSVWLIAADNREEAVAISGAKGLFGDVTIDLVVGEFPYRASAILWTNDY